MEMNTAEKFELAVDGISDALNTPRTGRQPLHPTQQNAPRAAIAQHPSNSMVGFSDIYKAGKGVIKRLRGRWTWPEEKGRSSTPRILRGSVDLRVLGPIKPRNCQRIVVLGAPRVGKSNIIQRFLGREFEEIYEPTSEDFHRKLYHIGGEAYQVDLLDAARERNFPARRRLTILTGDIFLIVFSLDDRASFKEACELRDEINTAKSKLLKLKGKARVPIVICGNKVDVASKRAVSQLEMRGILGEDAALFETSAKEGTGLEGVFRALASLGGLPDKIRPSQHQTVSIPTYQAQCGSAQHGRGGRAPEKGAPCAAVDPAALRPSVTSDLQLVLGPEGPTHNKPEICHIQ